MGFRHHETTSLAASNHIIFHFSQKTSIQVYIWRRQDSTSQRRCSYHQSGEMKAYIAQYGTVLESWFPLGGRGNTRILFNDPVIANIAQAHSVSSAQVIIRWHLQAGNNCIPGSSNEQHIIEDYDVWDFELSEEEMAQMTSLERDDRFADY